MVQVNPVSDTLGEHSVLGSCTHFSVKPWISTKEIEQRLSVFFGIHMKEEINGCMLHGVTEYE